MRSHYDGLTSNEASQRRSVEGPNVIISPSDITFWDIPWEELREPMILLLLIVGVLYSLLGEPVGAMTIFAVVLLLVPGRAGRRLRLIGLLQGRPLDGMLLIGLSSSFTKGFLGVSPDSRGIVCKRECGDIGV